MKQKKTIMASAALLAATGLGGVFMSAPSVSADVTGWEKVTVTGTVPASGGGYWNLAAYCSSGKKVMGGGYEMPSLEDDGLRVSKSHPTGFSTGWNVNFHQISGGYDVVVYAICATVS